MFARTRAATLCLALVCAPACSSSTPKSNTAATPKRDTNLLSGEDVAQTSAANVYDAIQRLRPQWLMSARIRRGGSGDEVQVYLDSTHYGTLTSLKGLSIGGVQEIHYLNATEATNRYGTGHTGGAIVVVMNK
jgi:hypothetical protein